MKVIVTADGTSLGTKIADEAGNDLTGLVTAVRFSHEAGRLPAVSLDLHCTPMSIAGEARLLGPGGRQIKRIIYADGGEDEF